MEVKGNQLLLMWQSHIFPYVVVALSVSTVTIKAKSSV